MKSTAFFLCLLLSAQLAAQDHILLLRGDTLLVKVTTLGKENISYYLISDTDKKVSEVRLSEVHKIIWRNGLSFIINQEFEEKLKKENAVVKAGKTDFEPKPTAANLPNTIALKTEPDKVIVYPELQMHRWLLWRTYTADGERLKRGEMAILLKKYDSIAATRFRRGNDEFKDGIKVKYLSYPPLVATLFFPQPLSTVFLLGGTAVNILSGMQIKNGNREMHEALLTYEQRRITNTIRPPLSLGKF